MNMEVNKLLHKDLVGLRHIERELMQKHEWERDLQMASEFQRAVLPQSIPIDYLRCETIYQPYHQISGDLYDYVLNREKELGVFVGDVTGHGISAALMTMMVHLALDSIRPDLPCNIIFGQLNKVLASRQTARSVSAVFFRIKPNGELSVCHAGSPSLLVLPANTAKIDSFSEGSCPLGMFTPEAMPYKEEQYQLQPGDRLVIYTDGLIEARNLDGESFGEERLLDILDYQRQASLAEMKYALIDAVKDFSLGRTQQDDMTGLVMEYTG